MNFIDSLTLLFLTLSAVKVSFSDKTGLNNIIKTKTKKICRPLFAKCSHWSLMCSSPLRVVRLGHRSCLNKLKCLVPLKRFKQPLRQADTIQTEPTHSWAVRFLCCECAICDDISILLLSLTLGDCRPTLKPPWRYYYALKAQWLHSELGRVSRFTPGCETAYAWPHTIRRNPTFNPETLHPVSE